MLLYIYFLNYIHNSSCTLALEHLHTRKWSSLMPRKMKIGCKMNFFT